LQAPRYWTIYGHNMFLFVLRSTNYADKNSNAIWRC